MGEPQEERKARYREGIMDGRFKTKEDEFEYRGQVRSWKTSICLVGIVVAASSQPKSNMHALFSYMHTGMVSWAPSLLLLPPSPPPPPLLFLSLFHPVLLFLFLFLFFLFLFYSFYLQQIFTYVIRVRSFAVVVKYLIYACTEHARLDYKIYCRQGSLVKKRE